MLIDDASHGAPSVNKAACRQETVVRVSNEPACLATRPAPTLAQAPSRAHHKVSQ